MTTPPWLEAEACGSLHRTSTRLNASGRAYLAFADEQPQLFRLMFASDLFSACPLDTMLIKAAGTCYQIFESLVAATLDDSNENTIKAATIALMSSTYGFAVLRMGDRLRPFMIGRLKQSDLVDAVLSMTVNTLPHVATRKHRKKT
jgi:Tetracyclin repressor-like, C-terminal domain